MKPLLKVARTTARFRAILGAALLAMPMTAGLTAESGRRVVTVETIPAVAGNHFSESRSFLGKIEAARSSRLGFELAGTVTYLGFEEGETVEADDVIARLDVSRLEVQRTQLRASLAEASAVERLAEATFKRHANLLAVNASSAQKFDESKQQLDSARAGRERIEAQIRLVEVDLAKSVLRAPYGGVISRRFIDEGTVVSPGEPLLQILETGQLEIRVGVSPAAAMTTRIGDVFELSGVRARLIRTLPLRETQSRTIDLILSVESSQRPLLAGDLIEVPLARKTEAEGFWLPRSALTESRRGIWACYVAKPETGENVSLLERRQVELLFATSEKVYVRGAIEPGEQVVSTGLQKLVPGQRVLPRLGSLVQN